MKNYNCIIIGAGPSGLAAAVALFDKYPSHKIMMVDAGLKTKTKCHLEAKFKHELESPAEDSDVDYDKGCRYRKTCKTCQTISGFGGCAGGDYISVKLCFYPSGKRLAAMLGEETTIAENQAVCALISRFGEIDLQYRPLPPMCAEKARIKAISESKGFKLFEHPAYVVSETVMKRFVDNVYKHLENKVDFVFSHQVDLLNDIDQENSTLKLGTQTVGFDKLIITGGRMARNRIAGYLESIDMLAKPPRVNIGRRLIVPSKYLHPIGKHFPDFKLKWEDESIKVETFCFNGGKKGGRLKFADYGDFVNIDGLVAEDLPGDNLFGEEYGNLAILAESNTDDEPVLEDVLRYWYKLVCQILEEVNGIEEQDIRHEIMYSPLEKENVWAKMKTDHGFWVKPNIAIVGDATGLAMGVVSSMVMGHYVGSNI